MLPSQCDLRNLLSYDPDTGELRWITRRGRKMPGDIAGCFDARNRLLVFVGGKLQYGHRVIWCWMTGEWPVLQIDHIDLDKRNNRWNNLRLATNSENQCNQSTHRNNTSGFKGVWLRRANGTWISEIKKDGIKHHLGTFKTPEEASDAYKAAASKLHGKFARH